MFKDIINKVILPIKLTIPQPLIEKIPALTSNEEIRMEKVYKYISADMKCLDIGCGWGNMLVKKHRMRGGYGIGIDVYPWEAADLIIEDSSNLPLEDSSFDCVTFIACLNHIPNKVSVLKEASRVLNNDGIIIITNLTPLISAIWHFVAYWDKDKNRHCMKEGEVFGLTDKKLSSLLRESGLMIVERERFSWALNNLYICIKTNLKIMYPEVHNGN